LADSGFESHRMRLNSLDGCGLVLVSENRKISSQPATYLPLS
jgi:hypothetical protein